MSPSIVNAPALARLRSTVLAAWPEHERFLARRFTGEEPAFTEQLAELVLALAEPPARFAADYRFLCELVLEEELHFRRTGRYRLSTFEEARAKVYDDRELMTRYMNGLLLTQVLWKNHADAIHAYVERFLRENPHGYRHLEIGPGHGLLLHFAASDPFAGSVTGWDLSDASVAATSRALGILGSGRSVRLERRDLYAPIRDDERFDSIVLSEVCEHLEDPMAALERVARLLAPGGRVFVNVPVNSPAPDHLYLLRSPEEAIALVERSGFHVTSASFFPATGATLERARKAELTISCAITATPWAVSARRSPRRATTSAAVGDAGG